MKIGTRVVSTCDLWNDEKTELLVLSGMSGTIRSFDMSENRTRLFVVAFADGQTTYCSASEISSVGVQSQV